MTYTSIHVPPELCAGGPGVEAAGALAGDAVVDDRLARALRSERRGRDCMHTIFQCRTFEVWAFDMVYANVCIF